jgi:hypothetical protein
MIAVCGWCSATGTCLEGSESGGMGGSCPAGWAWFGNECSDPCYSRSATCGTCTAGPTCGYCWTGTSAVCLDGDYWGPWSPYHSCAGGYSWFPDEC